MSVTRKDGDYIVSQRGGVNGFKRGLTFHTEPEAMASAGEASLNHDIVYVFDEVTREVVFTFDRR
jgi:hypothetical protein